MIGTNPRCHCSWSYSAKKKLITSPEVVVKPITSKVVTAKILKICNEIQKI